MLRRVARPQKVRAGAARRDHQWTFPPTLAKSIALAACRGATTATRVEVMVRTSLRGASGEAAVVSAQRKIITPEGAHEAAKDLAIPHPTKGARETDGP